MLLVSLHRVCVVCSNYRCSFAGVRLLAEEFAAGQEAVESQNSGGQAKALEAFDGAEREFHAHEILLGCPAAVFSPAAEARHLSYCSIIRG